MYRNSSQLIKDLDEIPVYENLQLVSFDITNMYTNIPTNKLIDIKSLCVDNVIDEKLKEEIITASKIVLKQNYFQFSDSFYIQDKGLAMGSPTSSIFSEIFLQYIENTNILDILLQNNIIGYFRYVDNILIIYNDNVTNIQHVFDSFNNIIPDITFTMEKETENKINFLDITIQKKENKFSFKIYRKPTTTDSIIPSDSCHPQEQKHAAIRHMINRMNTYSLNKELKDDDKNKI
jgi:hypothetical protein